MSQLFLQAPHTLLLKCSLPNCISGVFLSICYIIDGIFIGRYLGSDNLAAMGLVMPFVMIFFALSEMIAIGSSVRIAHSLGRGKIKEASVFFSTSLAFILSISALNGFLGFVLSPFLIDCLDISDILKSKAVDFVRVYSAFMPLVAFYFVMDNYLRICAKNMLSMLLNIFAALCNIALDYLFIVVLGLDLYAAALASVIAFTISGFFGFLPFAFGRLVLKFTRPIFMIKFFVNVFYNGFSEFLGNISGSILTIFANFLLLQLAGTQGVAIFSILLYIDSLIVSFIISLNDGLQAPLSYNFARKDKAHTKNIVLWALRVAFAISLIVFILLELFGANFIAFFTKDVSLIKLGASALSLYAFNYLVTWFNLGVSSFLTAFNKPFYSLILSLLQGFFAPLLSLFVLSWLYGLNGIWLTAFFGDLLCVGLAFYLLKKVVWH